MSGLHHDPGLADRLIAGGVVVPAPAAVVLRDLDPARIAPGVVLHPGVTLCGRATLLMAGAQLGEAGGGWFQDVACGRGVRLWGGHHRQAVYLDGVQLRGQAEARPGTLVEEDCAAGQHVGLKMTVLLSGSVLGSLVNFCDAILAGGRPGGARSEVGSCMAHYNFSPQGDKWASLFGDVPAGLLGLAEPVFLGGQTQIVGPVRVGAGSLIPAGAAVRRDVAPGRVHAEPPVVADRTFDAALYGPLAAKLATTLEVMASLAAIERFYATVRAAWAASGPEPLEAELYLAARRQLRLGIDERLARLDMLVDRLPLSAARHRALAAAGDEPAAHLARADEQAVLAARWPGARTRLGELLGAGSATTPALAHLADVLGGYRRGAPEAGFQDGLASLGDDARAEAIAELAGFIGSTKREGLAALGLTG